MAANSGLYMGEQEWKPVHERSDDGGKYDGKYDLI